MKRAALAAVLLCACPSLRSPEERAAAALARSEREGFRVELAGGGAVEVAPGASRWRAPTVLAGAGQGLQVFAQLSTEGRAAGVPFSYLGTERVRVACDGELCALDGDPAPRLTGVLTALRARREALSRGGEGLPELARLEPGDIRRAAERGCAAWFIRVDRDAAVVGEADASGVQHRLELAGEGGRWAFTSGLP